MQTLQIVKIGGNIIDDPLKLEIFLEQLASLKNPVILVHGGGKSASTLAKTLGIQQTMIDGRRVTDAETLNVTVMVYAGLINKTLVAKLQARNCNAIGFCGADGNLVRSKKREFQGIDFGFVGDIVENGVHVAQFQELLNKALIPVISPITHDGCGQLLNTNADTMAAKIASALCLFYDVSLIYCFENHGVLMDIKNQESYIPELSHTQYLTLKNSGIISKGMIPKLDNAFEALGSGVMEVKICHAEYFADSSTTFKGTKLTRS
jgi:acetylglutamate kinase